MGGISLYGLQVTSSHKGDFLNFALLIKIGFFTCFTAKFCICTMEALLPGEDPVVLQEIEHIKSRLEGVAKPEDEDEIGM